MKRSTFDSIPGLRSNGARLNRDISTQEEIKLLAMTAARQDTMWALFLELTGRGGVNWCWADGVIVGRWTVQSGSAGRLHV